MQKIKILTVQLVMHSLIPYNLLIYYVCIFSIRLAEYIWIIICLEKCLTEIERNISWDRY